MRSEPTWRIGRSDSRFLGFGGGAKRRAVGPWLDLVLALLPGSEPAWVDGALATGLVDVEMPPGADEPRASGGREELRALGADDEP